MTICLASSVFRTTSRTMMNQFSFQQTLRTPDPLGYDQDPQESGHARNACTL